MMIINQISSNRLLFIHGASDKMIAIEKTRIQFNQLIQKGGKAEFFQVENSPHELDKPKINQVENQLKLILDAGVIA